MHPESYDEMARLMRTYLSPQQSLHILDVGSYDVNGTYRPLFENPNWNYEGIDIQQGPNVDRVLDSCHAWPIADGQYDLVISGQTLEHVKFFWLTWKEMVRVLKPGGLIFLIAPSRGDEHRYPVDCWRFYSDGFRALGELEGLEVLEAETRWANPWGDTVGVFRKPLEAQAADEGPRKTADSF